MDASTALCGSGPAFFALILEAAADGAVAMGIPRAEAQKMAAQTMRGAAGLVLAGEHPAVLRDKVSTPGGCTIGGLLVLEEGSVRGTVSRAVREATVVASQLGAGVKNVNGTRH
jgi:pyrroline-5-carboxylate reductase